MRFKVCQVILALHHLDLNMHSNWRWSQCSLQVDEEFDHYLLIKQIKYTYSNERGGIN